MTEPGEVQYLQMGRKGNRFFGLHLSCVFEDGAALLSLDSVVVVKVCIQHCVV